MKFTNEKVAAIAANLTETLISQLEQDPAAWSKPWQSVGSADVPHNPVSKAVYRGTNVLVLSAQAWASGFSSGRWATYKQWQKADCQVRKGSEGTPIVRWNRKFKCEACGGSLKASACKAHPGESKSILFASTFTVFNADQVDHVDGGDVPVHPDYPLPDVDELDATAGADEVRSMLSTVGVDWVERPGDRAFYSPANDRVTTPTADQFDTVGGFAATVAHEFGHWTGHESRLDRGKGNRFGSEAYAFEELIAELTSVFVCNVIGVEHEPVANHAAYIKSWLSALKGDDGPGLLWKAGTDAQKATQWILDRVDDSVEVPVAA